MSATTLPVELCGLVEKYLPNSDIKSLRLVCRDFSTKFQLRLTRVFLSANPLNIHVFRSIAEHETFRHGIIEIIWDDARLLSPISLEPDSTDNEDDHNEPLEADKNASIPQWYQRICADSVKVMIGRGSIQSERPAHKARMRQAGTQEPDIDSWSHYQRLVIQQEEVLSTGADIDAFQYGLSCFPALRRLTITPAAHGFLFAPLYQTPMIRAFRYGFIYPVPCAWPDQDDFDIPYYDYILPWDDKEREKWRGICIALRELATRDHSITEFLIQANGLITGLSYRIFDQPCQVYDEFKALLSRPGFRYLELSLIADASSGYVERDWQSLTNGLLHEALSKATDLEHLDFWFPIDGGQQMGLHSLPPLDTILPIDQWPKLRHFGLGEVLVTHDGLISALQRLPSSIRSVNLSKLCFAETLYNHGSRWRDHLHRLRDDLDWRTRPPNQRPRIGVYVAAEYGSSLVRCIETEVESFVYGDGENPFLTLYNWFWVGKPPGVIRDPLEPDFEAP